MDLALNNLQRLICHKTQQTKPNQETNNTLPFLDILLINVNNKLEFKVHQKSTNKNDHIHFY